MTEGPINLLGEKHFYPILDRIARNGSARYTDLQDIGAHFYKLEEIIGDCIEKGLIGYTIQPKGRKAMVFTLTEKGWFVYNCLRTCVMIWEGELDLGEDRLYETMVEKDPDISKYWNN